VGVSPLIILVIMQIIATITCFISAFTDPGSIPSRVNTFFSYFFLDFSLRHRRSEENRRDIGKTRIVIRGPRLAPDKVEILLHLLDL